MNQKKFKLAIELVPVTLWHFSLFQLYKGSKQLAKWKKLKKELFEREERRCWIYGKEGGRLEAHEFWDYDDKNHVQRLAAIHHLCKMCHKIKHLGFWGTKEGREILGKSGLTGEDLIKHFCRVNDCSREEFEEHKREARGIWLERSGYQWTQDLGKYDSNIQREG